MEELRCYLMLIALTAQKHDLIKLLIRNIQSNIDRSAAPFWEDERCIGIAFQSTQRANDLWVIAMKGIEPRVTDAFVVELGSDWGAMTGSLYEKWLSTHVQRRPRM